MACEGSHTGESLREYERDVSACCRGAGRLAGEVVPAAAASKTGARRRSSCTRPASTTCRDVDVAIPRDGMTVVTGVSGSGKSTLAFDIIFAEGQRRYLESLNAYARQFVQPVGASRRRRDLRHPADGRHRAAHQPRRTQEHGGHADGGAPLPALALREARRPALPGLRPADRAAGPGRRSRPSDARVRGRRIELLAPLVVARKGYYTDLAEWAAREGLRSHLRVDGEKLPTARWPRLDRFKEHTLELPVGEVAVSARKAERELRETLGQALDFGKGVVHVLDGRRRASSRRARACPCCGRSFAEPDPRLFSYNSKHGWCEACFGTGLRIKGFDAEQSGEESWWNEWFEGEATACARCRGQRLNPEALAVRSATGRSRSSPRCRWTQRASSSRVSKLKGREREIARDLRAEIALAAGLPARRRASATSRSTARRRRSRAARRSASGSRRSSARTCAASATCSTSRRSGCTRATTSVLLDALEKLGRKGNTLLVVEHDEDTIRRADHLIDLGPGAGHARRTHRRRGQRRRT